MLPCHILKFVVGPFTFNAPPHILIPPFSPSPSQLRMLEGMFPRHVLEFVMGPSASFEQLGSLAYQHEQVTILFMVRAWEGWCMISWICTEGHGARS